MEQDKELDFLIELRNKKISEKNDTTLVDSQIMTIINKRQLESWNIKRQYDRRIK